MHKNVCYQILFKNRHYALKRQINFQHIVTWEGAYNLRWVGVTMKTSIRVKRKFSRMKEFKRENKLMGTD